MPETTYYIVGEGLSREGGELVTKSSYLTTDVSDLYKANASNSLLADTLEAWIKTVTSNEALQIALGYTLTVASENEVESYGPELKVIRAIDRINSAKSRFEQEILDNRRDVVEFFSEAITTQKEAASFLARYKKNAFVLTSWINSVIEEKKAIGEDWSFNPVAAKALSQAWYDSITTEAKKRETSNSDRYKKLVSWSK